MSGIRAVVAAAAAIAIATTFMTATYHCRYQ